VSIGKLSQCTVIIKHGEDPYLAAFMVASPGIDAALDVTSLHEIMTALPLPLYMRPAVVVTLDALPMTTNGATVSLLWSYTSLRAANLMSTNYLIALAASRRIPIHCISTAGVAQFVNLDPFPEVSLAHCLPPKDAMGYTSSKWASEAVLEAAYAEFQLPIMTIDQQASLGECAREQYPTESRSPFSGNGCGTRHARLERQDRSCIC
jgi:hypothetical protein